MDYRSPLTFIPCAAAEKRRIRLFLKRDDLLHPVIQGNKWRKLAPVIEDLKRGKARGVLSFGGAFSNHLHALAAAGQIFGFETIGILRGAHVDIDNPTLSFAHAAGMRLFPVPKASYDAGTAHPDIASITSLFPDFLLLPEGGNNAAAVANCRGIAVEIRESLQEMGVFPDHSEQFHVCLPAGTGCTAAGTALGMGPFGNLLIFPVDERIDISWIRRLAGPDACLPQLHFPTDYRFGGFAKLPASVRHLVDRFEADTGILLDPIYGSKMMFGVYDLLEKDYFRENSVVVALHTGGLQGWGGFGRN
jgi:1-aminocyclopropane-1-carboxylate deaminase